MYKTDSKDSHFVYHFTEASRSFHWEGYLYKFTNLVQPRIFTKLMKILIAVLRRMKTRVIAYL